jgi:hypothetical protein
MTDVLVDFNGGSVGSDIAAGSNGIQSVVDTPAPKFVTGFHGAAQVHAGGSSNTADCRFRVDTGNSGDQYLSVYLKYNTAHSSAGNFCIFASLCNSSNSIQISFRVGSNKEFNIRTGTSTVVRAGSSNEVPVNAEFRLDLQLTGTTCNWRIFYDPEADNATTPDLSGSFTFPSSTISRWIFGPNSSTALTKDFNYDTVRSSTSGWLNAFNPPSVGFSNVKIWNGSTEVTPSSIKVWNGSAEVSIDTITTH